MTKNTISGLFLFFSLMPMAAESAIYSIELQDIDGNDLTLDRFRGRAMLIVNVASKCGYTYQYESLEELYRKYKDDGLVVLGFPANDFLWQEPGTNEEIKLFCTENYDVTFPMFSKIKVTGRKIHPLYKLLTSNQTNPGFSGRITWNFNKFLVDGRGAIINRFDTKIEPDSTVIADAIEKALDSTKR